MVTNNKGFTVIEVIVILIIVGVLAAIALPMVFSWVTTSRSSTPLALMHTLRGTVDACIAKNLPNKDDVTANCVTNSNLPNDSGWRYDFTDGYGNSHAPFVEDQTNPYNFVLFAHPTTAITGLQSFLSDFSLVQEAYAGEADPGNYLPLAHAESAGSVETPKKYAPKDTNIIISPNGTTVCGCGKYSNIGNSSDCCG